MALKEGDYSIRDNSFIKLLCEQLHLTYKGALVEHRITSAKIRKHS